MFMGKYQNSIDAKCRMIIPAKFRDALGYRCVVTIGFDKCLYIYSMQEWEKNHEELSRLPITEEAGRQVIRDVYSNATDCEIDKQGRVVISQDLRDYANIEKDLVTVGASNKIEVWSKEEWENQQGGGAPRPSPSDTAKQVTQYIYKG